MDEKFVEDSFKELEEIEKQQLLSDEKVRAILTSSSTEYGSIIYGGVTIRFKLFIDKKLRHRMITMKGSFDNVDDESSLNATEKAIYELLGELCVDPPFNSWKTWAMIDERAGGVGGVQTLFVKIMGEIGRLAQDVKSFR